MYQDFCSSVLGSPIPIAKGLELHFRPHRKINVAVAAIENMLERAQGTCSNPGLKNTSDKFSLKPGMQNRTNAELLRQRAGKWHGLAWLSPALGHKGGKVPEDFDSSSY